MIAYKTFEASEMTLHPAKQREETRDQVPASYVPSRS